MIRRFHFLSLSPLLICSTALPGPASCRAELWCLSTEKKRKKKNKPLCPDLSMTLHENTWQNIQGKGQKVVSSLSTNSTSILQKCTKSLKKMSKTKEGKFHEFLWKTEIFFFSIGGGGELIVSQGKLYLASWSTWMTSYLFFKGAPLGPGWWSWKIPLSLELPTWRFCVFTQTWGRTCAGPKPLASHPAGGSISDLSAAAAAAASSPSP